MNKFLLMWISLGIITLSLIAGYYLFPKMYDYKKPDLFDACITGIFYLCFIILSLLILSFIAVIFKSK